MTENNKLEYGKEEIVELLNQRLNQTELIAIDNSKNEEISTHVDHVIISLLKKYFPEPIEIRIDELNEEEKTKWNKPIRITSNKRKSTLLQILLGIIYQHNIYKICVGHNKIYIKRIENNGIEFID